MRSTIRSGAIGATGSAGGSYLGAAPGAAEIPPYAAAARRKELRGFPPTWIGVGTADLFHAEDAEYAQRMRHAGVDVTYEEVRGAFHGFDVVAPWSSVARSFAASKLRFLRAHLG